MNLEKTPKHLRKKRSEKSRCLQVGERVVPPLDWDPRGLLGSENRPGTVPRRAEAGTGGRGFGRACRALWGCRYSILSALRFLSPSSSGSHHHLYSRVLHSLGFEIPWCGS